MITFAFAFHGTSPRADYLDITGSSTGTTSTMTVDGEIKEIPAKKAVGLITFWAFGVDESFGPGATNVAAVTIHHGANDHQVVGALDDDPKPVNQGARSTPVQSFHPHYANFDSDFCLRGLVSPTIDFSAKNNLVSLDTSDVTTNGFVITGTIGPRDECPLGLGIDGVDDHN